AEVRGHMTRLRAFGGAIVLLVIVIMGLGTTAAAADAKPEAPAVVLVRAGRLVDTLAGDVKADQDVLVENGVVKQVGANLQDPTGATVVDLRGKTVLPGLIDCHTHVTSQPENYYTDIFRRSPIDTAVRAHVFARRTLEAGFTTIRDVGAGEYIDVALKRAI